MENLRYLDGAKQCACVTVYYLYPSQSTSPLPRFLKVGRH